MGAGRGEGGGPEEVWATLSEGGRRGLEERRRARGYLGGQDSRGRRCRLSEGGLGDMKLCPGVSAGDLHSWGPLGLKKPISPRLKRSSGIAQERQRGLDRSPGPSPP